MTLGGLRSKAHRLLLVAYGRLPHRMRTFVVRRMTPSFSVGGICVIERPDGAVLLLRNSYRQGWGLPGGLLRRGEAVGDAVHREVREETSLEIELRGLPTVVVDPRARRVDVIFRAVPASAGDDLGAASSPEIREARWFDPTQLPSMQKESAAAIRLVLSQEASG